MLLEFVDEDGEDLPLELRVTREPMVEIEGHRENELPDWNVRDDLIDEMRCRLSARRAVQLGQKPLSLRGSAHTTPIGERRSLCSSKRSCDDLHTAA